MARKNDPQVSVRYTPVEYARLAEAATAVGAANRTQYVHDAALMRMDGRLAAEQPPLESGGDLDQTWQIIIGHLRQCSIAAGADEDKLNTITQALARAQKQAKEAGHLVPASGLDDLESALKQALLDEMGGSLAAHLRLDVGGRKALQDAAQRVADAHAEAMGKVRNGK